MNVCPVLSFTAEVREYLDRFRDCYELVVGHGAAFYRLARLPGKGTIGEQDERTMSALEWLAVVKNDALAIARRDDGG